MPSKLLSLAKKPISGMLFLGGQGSPFPEVQAFRWEGALPVPGYGSCVQPSGGLPLDLHFLASGNALHTGNPILPANLEGLGLNDKVAWPMVMWG